MKILISNDDGVNAPGIQILAETLAMYAEIIVVAPDRDRSAASNSLTLEVPLRINRYQHFYAVNGTPTDCVHLAITGGIDFQPDMIISGINAGANLGDDVIYSGTVAAAMEGRFLGYPAMAISLVTNGEKGQHYITAAKVASFLLKNLLKVPLPPQTILNVNVPNRSWEDLAGIKITRLGQRHLAESSIRAQDARGKEIFWIGPPGPEQDAGPGTDFHAINQGYISITPIKIDLTDHAAIDKLLTWSNDFTL